MKLCGFLTNLILWLVLNSLLENYRNVEIFSKNKHDSQSVNWHWFYSHIKFDTLLQGKTFKLNFSKWGDFLQVFFLVIFFFPSLGYATLLLKIFTNSCCIYRFNPIMLGSWFPFILKRRVFFTPFSPNGIAHSAF